MRHTAIHHLPGRASRVAKFLALGFVLSGIVILTVALPGSGAARHSRPARAEPVTGRLGAVVHAPAGPVWLARAGGHHRHPFWRS